MPPFPAIAQTNKPSPAPETVGRLLDYVPADKSEEEQIAEWNAMLDRFTDDELVMVAKARASEEQAERLEMLIREEKDDGLSADEQQELDRLFKKAERMTYLKGRAAALLRQRGYDPLEILSGA